jgi:hypothetical protein
MLFECGNHTLGRIDLVVMGRNKVDVHAVAPDVALTALGHSWSMTLSIGAYPHSFRWVRMLVNAAIMVPLFLDGMAWMRITFRS